MLVELGKEIDVLVMTEESVHVIRLSQNVSTPTVQHGDLQERCEVFRFVLQKQVSWGFVK